MKTHKKFGKVRVLAVCPTDKGGLAQIDTPEHGIFWVRAAEVDQESYQ